MARGSLAAIGANPCLVQSRRKRSCTSSGDTLSGLENAVKEPRWPGPVCASVDEVLDFDEWQKQLEDATLDCRGSAEDAKYGVRSDYEKCGIGVAIPAPLSEDMLHVVEDEADLMDVDSPSSREAFTPPSPKVPMKPHPSSMLIPVEILRQIYTSLAPADFDSARHTCKLWLISSLDLSLLSTMLRRGGWPANSHLQALESDLLDGQTCVDREWLMSKCLARECALGPDWRGNGMSSISNKGSPSQESISGQTPFRLCSKFDFAQYQRPNLKADDMLFSVSACTNFLMVACGCIVFVYEFSRSRKAGRRDEMIELGSMRLITSIVCPRKVLACSMDSSYNRDAVAILMESRAGLVCTVTGSTAPSGRECNVRDLSKVWNQSNILPISCGGSWSNNIPLGMSPSRPHRATSDRNMRFSVLAAERLARAESGVGLDDYYPGLRPLPPPPRQRSSYSSLVPPPYSMSAEASPPTLYAPLCSSEDPPRSIALCPQRRCVAFGCASGIELHWVDALTGRDLNRWFPLTAPSDYLHFLAPRSGIDSAKKLRLVSSQRAPGERCLGTERFSGKNELHSSHDVCGDWNQNELFMGAGGDADFSQGCSRDESDHYRAVPLSDGYHLLFIDAASGVLCLGNDAPLGSPAKFERLMWFSGPVGGGSPVAHAAASDLRWGVRVLAAYGVGAKQSIWLFSVPADVLAHSYDRNDASRSRNLPGGTVEIENTDWMSWWTDNDGGSKPRPSARYRGASGMIWPVQVRGQEVGRCAGVMDLAIHTGPGIGVVIWAFSKSGIALAWALDDGKSDHEVKRRMVVADGSIRKVDGGGDVEMGGTAEEGVGGREWRQGGGDRARHDSIRRDGSGDVVMTDVEVSGREEGYRRRYESSSFDAVAVTGLEQRGLYWTRRRDA